MTWSIYIIAISRDTHASGRRSRDIWEGTKDGVSYRQARLNCIKGRSIACCLRKSLRNNHPAKRHASPMDAQFLLQRLCEDGVNCDSITMLMRSIGHALRKQTAGQFGPDLAKKLSQLVKMEKNVMRSMELVGRERMEVAVSFQIWRKCLRLLMSDTATTLHLG